jgi:hypothetical protein
MQCNIPLGISHILVFQSKHEKKQYYCYWSEWNLSLELSTKEKLKNLLFGV